MLYTLFRSLVTIDCSRYCGCCGASIPPHDLVGVGAGVCPAAAGSERPPSRSVSSLLARRESSFEGESVCS
jgi:hypothetical protein